MDGSGGQLDPASVQDLRQYFESRYITFMERTALKRTSSVMSSNALIESMYTSLLYVSASVVTTLWRYTNLIILIIIAVFITVKNVRDKERLSRDGIKNVIAKMSEVRSLICCIINVDYVIDNIL